MFISCRENYTFDMARRKRHIERLVEHGNGFSEVITCKSAEQNEGAFITHEVQFTQASMCLALSETLVDTTMKKQVVYTIVYKASQRANNTRKIVFFSLVSL